MELKEIFSTVVNMSMTGSIVILLVLAARAALKRAPKIFSYCLWAVVLFRLLCPVSVSSVFSALRFPKAPEVVTGGVVSTMDYAAAVDVYLGIPELSFPEPESRPNITPATPENRTEPSRAPDAAAQQTAAESVGDPVDYAVFIWLMGLGAMLIWNLVSVFRLLGQLTGAVRLRRNIYIGDHVPTPFVVGIVWPRIYLPSSIEEQECRYIIAHERTHIRRGDHMMRLLAYLALCLHWFNPLVWLAFSLSGKDMEMSCDEAVIRMYGPKIRAEYSASLLRLATGHRGFALTPLAFGEGDTKGRVMNMAKWKKPGIWVTVFALILCAAVLVACGLNPEQKQPEQMITETEPETQPADRGDFPWDENLSMEKICRQAVDELVEAESYHIHYEYSSGTDEGGMEYYRHGENLLIQNRDTRYPGGTVYFEGEYGMHLGDCWVNMGAREFDANEWLQRWSPEGKELGHCTAEDNSISFFAIWDHQLFAGQRYEGTFTYTFHEDGSLESITREYTLLVDGEPASQTTDMITPMAHSPEDAYNAIKTVAESCISQEERDERLLERDTITEIPSNKRDYDKDFALGSVLMGWKFVRGEGFFKLGTENAASTGAELRHCEYGSNIKSLVAEPGFWLEKLVDGRWEYVDEKLTEVHCESVQIRVGEDFRYRLDWADSYGELAPGYYRIGRYYTMTLENGQSEENPCYAKFTVLDSQTGDLLRQCREGLENLLNSGYHIRVYTLVDNEVFRHFDDQIWKMGTDYLSRRERTRADGTVDIDGAMLRSGFGYSLIWEDGKETEPVTEWSRLDYLDESNFLMWSWGYDLSEDRIREISREGDTVRVLLKFDSEDEYTGQEVLFTFDENGMIRSLSRSYILKDGSKLLMSSVELLDTPGQKIRSLIDAQNIVTPMPFSYKEDVEKYPNAQKEGFHHGHHGIKVDSMSAAIRLAYLECSLPEHDTNGEVFNIIQVYRDVEAGIWKVVLRYSQDSDLDQYVYISDEGVTQMIVSE